MLEYFAGPGSAAGTLGVGYSLRTGAEGLRALLPALGAQIQIVLQGRMEHVRPSGPVRVPTVALVGPTSRAFEVAVSPSSWVVGCGLLPGGWEPVTGVPAHEALDAVLDLSVLWRRSRIERLTDGPGTSPVPAEAVALLCRGVLRDVPPIDPVHRQRLDVVERWLAGPRSASIDALTTDLGLGRRQVSRLVQRDFGCSAKQLQMKYRALRLSVRMTLERRPPTAGAWVGGSPYFDQSHLTQEFQRFIGVTPQRFLDDDTSLSKTLIRSRLGVGARGPSALWS